MVANDIEPRRPARDTESDVDVVASKQWFFTVVLIAFLAGVGCAAAAKALGILPPVMVDAVADNSNDD